MFCKICGLELNNDAVFCPKCGTKIQSNNHVPKTKKKDPIDYFFLGLKNYFLFDGQSSRKEFWIYMLYVFSLCITFFITSTIDIFTIPSIILQDILFFSIETKITYINFILYIIITSFLFLPTVSISIRRLHDCGKSGWFLLCPVMNVVYMFFKSSPQKKERVSLKQVIIGKIITTICLIGYIIVNIVAFISLNKH